MQFWPRGVGSTACPSPHSSAQLAPTVCDPCGTQRVGRAWWGGAGLPRGAPGRSRRAQRARHALPEAGRVPDCALLRRASSILTARDGWGARRVGRAVLGRSCWAVLGPRVGWRPSPKGAHEPAQAAHAPGAAPPPTALRHEPAGADEQPARRSSVRGARCSSRRGRSVAHWRSDGTTSPRSRSRRPRGRAVGIFARG